MTADALLTDCDDLLKQGNTREAARRLERLGPLAGPQAARRDALWQRIRLDRQVLLTGVAVSVALVLAVWASYT